MNTIPNRSPMNFFGHLKPGFGSQWYPRIPGRSNSSKRQLRRRQANILDCPNTVPQSLTYSLLAAEGLPEPILHPNEVLIQAFTNKRTTVGRATDKGTVYVTSERLIFIPHVNNSTLNNGNRYSNNNSRLSPHILAENNIKLDCNTHEHGARTASVPGISEALIMQPPRHGEVDIIIADLISMNVIETTPTRHHFLFVSNPENDDDKSNWSYINGMPSQKSISNIDGSIRFSSAIKAQSFLGLIFSIWVEQQVREALDETIDRGSLPTANGQSGNSCDEFNGPTDILPTYAESQAALQRYLTRRQCDTTAATANG